MPKHSWPHAGKQASSIYSSTGVKLISYSGDKIDTCGEAYLDCKFKNKEHKIRFYLVNENVTPILGLKTCTDLATSEWFNESTHC